MPHPAFELISTLQSVWLTDPEKVDVDEVIEHLNYQLHAAGK